MMYVCSVENFTVKRINYVCSDELLVTRWSAQYTIGNQIWHFGVCGERCQQPSKIWFLLFVYFKCYSFPLLYCLLYSGQGVGQRGPKEYFRSRKATVLDAVLGFQSLWLAQHTRPWLVSSLVVPDTMHLERLRALEGRRASSKSLSRVRDQDKLSW